MTPVVDISQHQGAIDFSLMRSRGVRGLIIRATHGYAIDTRFREYVRNARSAGYTDRDIGFYTFCNPKRGPGYSHGLAFVAAVRTALGHTDTFFMLDAEWFAGESGSWPALTGPAYAQWLREFVRGINFAAPGRPVMIYTSAAFWNPNVQDSTFGDFDIIIARYVFYSVAAPRPPVNAADWDTWVMGVTTKRPQLPRGWTTWDGWQFSAGFNRSGPTYGCTSSDLDLNIVDDAAWKRWTRPIPPTPEPITVPMWAATGGLMLRFVGLAGTTDGTRWLSNGQVRTPITFEYANWLIAHGMVGNQLDNADMLTADELAGCPLAVS